VRALQYIAGLSILALVTGVVSPETFLSPVADSFPHFVHREQFIRRAKGA
jgi:hypothetical protein